MHGLLSFQWLACYRLSMVPPKQPYQRLLAGGIAGALARSLVAPFERLRTIMQSSSSQSLGSAARGMWQDGGLRGTASVIQLLACHLQGPDVHAAQQSCQ